MQIHGSAYIIQDVHCVCSFTPCSIVVTPPAGDLLVFAVDEGCKGNCGLSLNLVHYGLTFHETSPHPNVSANSLLGLALFLDDLTLPLARRTIDIRHKFLFSVRFLACHCRNIMLIFTICSHQMCH